MASSMSSASCNPSSMPDSRCMSRNCLFWCSTRIDTVVRPSASAKVVVVTASASGAPSKTSVELICVFGPTSRTDGTQNLVGALRTCMGVCGATTLPEMHEVEMVIAPSIKTEGKLWQLAGAK